jgi:hypothetical protein
MSGNADQPLSRKVIAELEPGAVAEEWVTIESAIGAVRKVNPEGQVVVADAVGPRPIPILVFHVVPLLDALNHLGSAKRREVAMEDHIDVVEIASEL